MQYYLRFKKWIEQKKIQRMLDKLTFVLIVTVGLIFLVILNSNDAFLSRVLGISTQVAPILSSTETPTNIPVPTNAPLPTLNAANTPCGPGQHSGQYVYLKTASECQNYIDCQLNDGSWKLMTKSECSTAQGKTNSGAKIDCVGPDGKHVQTT